MKTLSERIDDYMARKQLDRQTSLKLRVDTCPTEVATTLNLRGWCSFARRK